jgi:hypothetical protein
MIMRIIRKEKREKRYLWLIGVRVVGLIADDGLSLLKKEVR